MRFVCPLLVVSDLARSVGFYRDLLGQRVLYDFGENVTFAGDFALHQASHYTGLLGPGAPPVTYGSHSGELYFEDDDPAAVEETLRGHGVEFVHPLREQPWRQRVLRFYDPDRHLIEVGETMAAVVRRLAAGGFSAAKIQQATSMPAEFVQDVLSSQDGCAGSPGA